MERDDRELIDRFLGGDPESFEEIRRWIALAVRSYHRRLGERWEDAVQEVVAEVYRLLKDDKFRGGSRLKTYVWRVANHTCLDWLRAEDRRGGRKVELDAEEGPPARALVEQPADAAERDLLLRVASLMGKECRRLWRMILEGRSYREMAREVDASEGALRVRVLRCRKRAIEVRKELLSVAAGARNEAAPGDAQPGE